MSVILGILGHVYLVDNQYCSWIPRSLCCPSAGHKQRCPSLTRPDLLFGFLWSEGFLTLHPALLGSLNHLSDFCSSSPHFASFGPRCLCHGSGLHMAGSVTAGDWVGPELAASSLSWDWVILPGGQPAAVFAGTDSNCLCRQALQGQLRRFIGYNLPGYPLMLHCEGRGLALGSYKKKCMLPWLLLCPGTSQGEMRATAQKRNWKLTLQLIFCYCLGLCGWWPLESRQLGKVIHSQH